MLFNFSCKLSAVQPLKCAMAWDASTISLLFGAFCVTILIITLWLRKTTLYELGSDYLVISRAGRVWMNIHLADVESIEARLILDQRLLLVRLYKYPPIFGRTTRIKKTHGFRYVDINPDDPQKLIDAWKAYQSAHASD